MTNIKIVLANGNRDLGLDLGVPAHRREMDLRGEHLNQEKPKRTIPEPQRRPENHLKVLCTQARTIVRLDKTGSRDEDLDLAHDQAVHVLAPNLALVHVHVHVRDPSPTLGPGQYHDQDLARLDSVVVVHMVVTGVEVATAEVQVAVTDQDLVHHIVVEASEEDLIEGHLALEIEEPAE